MPDYNKEFIGIKEAKKTTTTGRRPKAKKPVTEQASNPIVRALADVLEWAKGNRGPKTGNPYGIPEVKNALKVLAREQGIGDYFDVDTARLAESEDKPIKEARFDYATVDLRTIEGVKKAERLKAAGWTVVSSSPDVIQFQKKLGESIKEAADGRRIIASFQQTVQSMTDQIGQMLHAMDYAPGADDFDFDYWDRLKDSLITVDAALTDLSADVNDPEFRESRM
jgi:hypothetical protein